MLLSAFCLRPRPEACGMHGLKVSEGEEKGDRFLRGEESALRSRHWDDEEQREAELGGLKQEVGEPVLALNTVKQVMLRLPSFRRFKCRAQRFSERWVVDVTRPPCGGNGWGCFTSGIECHDREFIRHELSLLSRAKEMRRHSRRAGRSASAFSNPKTNPVHPKRKWCHLSISRISRRLTIIYGRLKSG